MLYFFYYIFQKNKHINYQDPYASMALPRKNPNLNPSSKLIVNTQTKKSYKFPYMLIISESPIHI